MFGNDIGMSDSDEVMELCCHLLTPLAVRFSGNLGTAAKNIGIGVFLDLDEELKTVLDRLRNRASIYARRMNVDQPAIETNDSQIDLAGVRIIGRNTAIAVTEDSKVVLSVCSVSSPRLSGDIHAFYDLSTGEDL